MKRLTALAIFSILLALVAHFGVFYFLGIRPPEMRKPMAQPFEVVLSQQTTGTGNASSVQQGVLLDSAPLFMPTIWNLGSQMSDVASLQQATEVFSAFPSELELPVAKPALPWNRPESDSLGLPPLAQDPLLLLARFGRQSKTIPSSSGRPPLVKAVSLLGGDVEPPAPQPLPSALSSTLPDSLWTPVQFYFHVAGGHPVGSPVLARSSGFTDWDQSLKGYIGSLDYHGSLHDGYYRITVFP